MNKKKIIKVFLSITSVAALSTFAVNEPVQAKSVAPVLSMMHSGGHHSHSYATPHYSSGSSQHHSHAGMHWQMMGGHAHYGYAFGDHQDGHDQSGELPEGIRAATDPTYKTGEHVILQEGHMPGMEGAAAVIGGAYATTAYEVTYYPTDGSGPVTHHKWVVQEEIRDVGTGKLAAGTQVILEADHMPGMEGAVAVIEAAADTTVYMVDYYPTDGSAVVHNHQWVTDDELAPAP